MSDDLKFLANVKQIIKDDIGRSNPMLPTRFYEDSIKKKLVKSSLAFTDSDEIKLKYAEGGFTFSVTTNGKRLRSDVSFRVSF